MAQNPEILVLDEPSASLDPSEFAVFRSMILKLKAEKLILLSSHLLYEVTQVCDSVLFISKGKLVHQGTFAEVSQRFASKALRIEFSASVNENQISTLRGQGLISEYSKEGDKTYSLNFDGSEEKRRRIIDTLMPLRIHSVSDARLSLEKAYLELLSNDGTGSPKITSA